MEWLLGHGAAGLFADPGCGKTSIVLRALLALKDVGVGGKALVVAPLRVCKKVWPVEAGEWKGSEWDRLRTLRIVLLHGKYKEEALKQDADVYVINFDGLKWLFQEHPKEFKALECDTFVVDESSKMKHTKTKRFKMVKPWLSFFSRRWILTGSPNPNGYLDLFGQIYILDLGKALGRYITHYRQEFFTPLDRFGWTWALKSGAENRIQKAVAPYIFRLDADDYIKMPKAISNIVRVELPPEARKVYDDLEQIMVAQLEQHTVVAVSTGAAQMKCAQVANGGLYHMEEDRSRITGKRTWTDIHEAKIEAVQDIVEELQGSPCMIAYDFNHDLSRLQKAFPGAPYIGGGSKNFEQVIDDFNADKIPVLLVQPQTVSHGLNPQYGSAQHLILHSLMWDYEVYDQLIRRLRRQGSRHDTIFVHHIVAENTVDEAKLRALRKKERTQRGFLTALKEYIKARKSDNVKLGSFVSS